MQTESQYQVLTYLSKDADTSQRKIAEDTGISVGMVNILLKKMVKKGLVKLERINGKTLRYILTPQGMKEKSKFTYRYMKNSYIEVLKLRRALQEIVTRDEQKSRIVFYGPQDEILEILKMTANDLGLTYLGVQSNDELNELNNKNTVIITWHTEKVQDISHETQVINILENI